jgi:hypothetical protein
MLIFLPFLKKGGCDGIGPSALGAAPSSVQDAQDSSAERALVAVAADP